jgi:REP-associated tyrosine transposase
MAHSITKNHLHLVFSTRHRRKLMNGEIQERLWQYLTGICTNIELVPVWATTFRRCRDWGPL